MLLPIVLKSWLQRATFGSILIALISMDTPASTQNTGIDPDHQKTATPIKHVIVLIGENRTFDHVFATYVPRGRDSVQNLLSEGIINANGSPGWNFSKAAQFQAVPPFKTEYFISWDRNEKVRYRTLPQPTLNFAPVAPTFPAGTPASLLAAVEPWLDADDLNLLTTGAASQFTQTFFLPDPDTRAANFNSLPNGPFPLKGKSLPYDSYTGDTTHRFFEMWQQSDCNIKNATRQNPSGCLSDLYPFVITNYTNIIDPAHQSAGDRGQWRRQFHGVL